MRPYVPTSRDMDRDAARHWYNSLYSKDDSILLATKIVPLKICRTCAFWHGGRGYQYCDGHSMQHLETDYCENWRPKGNKNEKNVQPNCGTNERPGQT